MVSSMLHEFHFNFKKKKERKETLPFSGLLSSCLQSLTWCPLFLLGICPAALPAPSVHCTHWNLHFPSASRCEHSQGIGILLGVCPSEQVRILVRAGDIWKAASWENRWARPPSPSFSSSEASLSPLPSSEQGKVLRGSQKGITRPCPWEPPPGPAGPRELHQDNNSLGSASYSVGSPREKQTL